MPRRPERSDEAYVKRTKAAEMRRAGHTWEEVAAECGYTGKGSAHNAVKLLLQEHQSLAYEEVALLRQESLDRYVALLKAVWPHFEKQNYGRTYLGMVRTTYLVDAAGRIAQVWDKVKVKNHAAEVLAAAQAS